MSNEQIIDENAVTKNAKPGDPQPKGEGGTPGQGGYQDLGGPTPQNSKPTDDSNKYKTGGGPTASAPQTKPSAASGKKAEFSDKGDVQAGHEPEGEVIAETPDQETETIEIDLSADVAALTEGEDLSEEFKEKAKTIFEAAVVSRINEELERMHKDYAKVLDEEVETMKSELAEKVDETLKYHVDSWIKNNELAIEHGIKTEMAESVMAGLKQVFVENHIDLPDEKVDLVDEMTKQLDTMESKLNEQIEENVGLAKEVGSYIKNGIVNELSEGLSLTQKEKLQSLAEAVEFSDEDAFRDKVNTLKESYFSTKPAAAEEKSDEVTIEGGEIAGDAMSAYATALSRWAR